MLFGVVALRLRVAGFLVFGETGPVDGFLASVPRFSVPSCSLTMLYSSRRRPMSARPSASVLPSLRGVDVTVDMLKVEIRKTEVVDVGSLSGSVRLGLDVDRRGKRSLVMLELCVADAVDTVLDVQMGVG